MDAFIVSYGQDTNGQNARFVQASRRFGAEMMQSFAIGSDDPAGVVGRYQLATRKYDVGLRIRSAHRVSHYFDFPGDLVWEPKTEPEIKRLIREADVVHLNNSYRAATRFGIRKPMLLHHHGSMFRNNTASMLAFARHNRLTQAVSTIDLLRPAPDVLHWLPSAYDIDELGAFGAANRREPDGRIRIVHAPTNRKLKHTDLFLEAIGKLIWDGLPIDLVLVEGKTNAECLAEKAKADIVYDQLAFGYGCNSIEAWGMGVPVIAGADNWTLNKMEDLWGSLPFAEANEGTLSQVIEQMVLSADMRAEYAQRGFDHVLTYHAERPALERLAELYDRTIRLYHRVEGTVVPVRFRNRGRDLKYQGEVVLAAGAETDTADPDVIAWLRGLSQRPTFGVEEVA